VQSDAATAEEPDRTLPEDGLSDRAPDDGPPLPDLLQSAFSADSQRAQFDREITDGSEYGSATAKAPSGGESAEDRAGVEGEVEASGPPIGDLIRAPFGDEGAAPSEVRESAPAPVMEGEHAEWAADDAAPESADLLGDVIGSVLGADDPEGHAASEQAQEEDSDEEEDLEPDLPPEKVEPSAGEEEEDDLFGEEESPAIADNEGEGEADLGRDADSWGGDEEQGNEEIEESVTGEEEQAGQGPPEEEDLSEEEDIGESGNAQREGQADSEADDLDGILDNSDDDEG
jgi:hypothetical protein